MNKSKVNMPKELKRKCNIIIHSATGASAVAGLIPIPMSDAIPITAAQIGMIIKKSAASLPGVQNAMTLYIRHCVPCQKRDMF